MEIKKSFVLLLNEASREDIKAYYPEISDEDYNKILDVDKTGTTKKVGDFSRIVLDLYVKSKFPLDTNTLRSVFEAYYMLLDKRFFLKGTKFEKYIDPHKIENIDVLFDVVDCLETDCNFRDHIKERPLKVTSLRDSEFLKYFNSLLNN